VNDAAGRGLSVAFVTFCSTRSCWDLHETIMDREVKADRRHQNQFPHSRPALGLAACQLLERHYSVRMALVLGESQ
jgi:hypothetical protein